MSFISDQDVQNFGGELIGLSMRAAAQYAAPQLQAIAQQNAALEQQLAIERRHRLDMAVEAAIPNWREIEMNPAWHNYCLGIHELSGQVRQTHMNDAINRGDARAVIAMFNEFLGSGGQYGEPRQESYTRGRARRSQAGIPASAASGGILTRQQIKDLYEARRRGKYSDAEWAPIEQQIIAMAAAGRVPGAITDIAGR